MHTVVHKLLHTILPPALASAELHDLVVLCLDPLQEPVDRAYVVGEEGLAQQPEGRGVRRVAMKRILGCEMDSSEDALH